MEQHNADDPRDADDAWHQVANSWSDIGERLKERYREVVGDEGPSETEVRDALRTLGTAVQAVFDSLGTAMRDPEVRTQMKDATAGFASAVGQTFSDLGDEIRRVSSDEASRTGTDIPDQSPQNELPDAPSA